MERRSFLQSLPALFALPNWSLHRNTGTPPRVALIGAGWYGKSDLLRLIQVAEVDLVGICDVDRHMLEETLELLSQRQPHANPPATYLDYKALLNTEQPEIVLIGTPDHQHAVMAIDAMEAGADLYLQKPISCDVLEGEAILATARKLGRKVQIGTQRRSTPHLLDAKQQIVDAGLLGEIGHVEMCCYYHMRSAGDPAVEPVPAHFDYDRWTGPAPLIPYTGLPHRRWRSRKEYSNGIVGDMCVHMFDTARWLLGLGWPDRIASTGGIHLKKDEWANTADTQTATFSYPDFDCVWQHRSWGPSVDPDYPWGLFIYGSKGSLKLDTKKWSYRPNDRKATDLQKQSGTALYERERYPEDVDEKGIELHVASATRAHLADLLRVRGTVELPNADVLQGHISTASCILANISRDLGGRPLVYDPQQHLVVDDPEATALLKRPYREGYVHPYDRLG